MQCEIARVTLSHPDLNELSNRIIGCAIDVHRTFGPGLSESIYEESLAMELVDAELGVERQKVLRVRYKGRDLKATFRADLVVNGLITVEIKSVEKTHPIHEAQLLSYMRLSNTRVGLLFNFNTLKLADSIKRLSL